jgi:hypothetical protein
MNWLGLTLPDVLAPPTGRKRLARLAAKYRRATVTAISALLLAAAPKCPICFLAYFGIFGVATSSAPAYRAWLPPIIGFWLALTIAMLAFQRRGKPLFGPAALGLVAALLLMIGKFAAESQLMVFIAVITLFGAAIWRARTQLQKSTQLCSQCEELPLLHDK